MKRIALCAALGLALGTAHAATTELIIYKSANFKGPSHTVKGEVNNLEGGFAREGQSLVVRGGNWEVCTDDHFRGKCYVLGPGEYPSLDSTLNNRIVSVRFVENRKAATYGRNANQRGDYRGEHRNDAGDWREARRDRDNRAAIDLYGRQDFRGRSLRVDDNERDLSRNGFDGRASSLVVHDGTWELCTEPGFQGRCQRYRPGEYRYLAGLDDRVSSVRQVR
ncbi:MAG TPA: beta/gamma crystallin-related protein [Usitatibacter sp.]|nr:beta/gamma crystallin-related protein [Usitatibacter sp.]